MLTYVGMCTNTSHLTTYAYTCTQMAEMTAKLETLQANYDMALAREKKVGAELHEARRRQVEWENRKGAKVRVVSISVSKGWFSHIPAM
jgi:hypothetical protein